MKQLALILVLVCSGLIAQAQGGGPIDKDTKIGSCGYNTQGGADTFPWSLAQPFPWDTIQGLWRVSDEPDQVVRMRVVREDLKVKHLSVDVLSRRACASTMKGVGLVTAAEKNVVRLSLTDDQGETHLMKLAFFDTRDLRLDQNICGASVLAATVVHFDGEGEDDIADDQKPVEQSNMMLKKITDSTDFHCKKRSR
ncbi:hypothetical protein CIK05_00765 [Bdellovibrio sp. qaytius]|nr:hypothetical protein CIK05_00765 [Bdellovibrio sp. qaytius]